MAMEQSGSEESQNLSIHERFKTDIPSIRELECILDSCRMELNHVDEVWPNLYIGDMLIAHDKKELRKLGITHVLNAAHSAWGSKGDQGFYGPEIHYHGIAAEDSTDFNLRMHFYPASKYINKALNVLNGKILVHCVLGKSRSASLVLSYLMIYHHFSLADAVEKIIQHRAIFPNRGFLKQLQDLDIELRYKIKLCELL
ncbi:PREDICTED: dual specificity protein phosphatase 13-like [Gavialis gangeticus]|uniref:dual specificity protein phosphatase 13-like n=1 Tax=Gavialis gangeticus TaxID=94835 RepID=UPI00092F7A31|nr:PREDICTED: dual specificity protein phosphatase 13-like [Gavialis gangeticus]